MTERNWEVGSTYEPPEPGGKSLEDYENFLGFKKESLDGKTVLDLGSGENEHLSQQLKENQIDAHVVSLNPDYALDSWLRKNVKKKNPDGESVAGLAQALPFKDGSFDFVLGLESVSRYSKPSKDFEISQEWGKEIVRVLKEGGEARLWPIIELDAEAGERDFNLEDTFDQFVYFLENLGVQVITEKSSGGYRLIIKKSGKQQ